MLPHKYLPFYIDTLYHACSLDLETAVSFIFATGKDILKLSAYIWKTILREIDSSQPK